MKTIPSKLIDFLNNGQVPYEVVHHPVAFTSQELAAIEGVKGREHAKVVIVIAGERRVMAVLTSDYRIDFERLGQIVGHPVRLATEPEFREVFPDCALGTMPPFSQLYGVDMYVDPLLSFNERIAFEAGTHCDAVKMTYADYAKLAQPVLADFAVKPTVKPK